jgi:hypothetical protein
MRVSQQFAPAVTQRCSRGGICGRSCMHCRSKRTTYLDKVRKAWAGSLSITDGVVSEQSSCWLETQGSSGTHTGKEEALARACLECMTLHMQGDGHKQRGPQQHPSPIPACSWRKCHAFPACCTLLAAPRVKTRVQSLRHNWRGSRGEEFS